MVSMSDELKERNILKLILIVRFACATLDVGHPILSFSELPKTVPAGSNYWLCLNRLVGQDLELPVRRWCNSQS
jgi:hypothetical protein